MRGRKVKTLAIPDFDLRTMIAETVHAVIRDLMGTDGSDRCAYYAAVAANIMPHVTGGRYTINSGSMQLVTAPDGEGFEFNAHSPLVEGGEFHTMLVRDLQNGQFEIADLAARHWKTWALRLGAFWDAPDPPRFVWGTWNDFEVAWPLGVWFQADEELTQRHIQWIQTRGSMHIRMLSREALKRLGYVH